MFGYRLVKEAELAAEARERGNERNELTFLRGRAMKFDAELRDLKQLAGEKGRALELLSEHVKDARLLTQAESHRADVAERMVEHQDASIKQLMASNDRMVDLVASMRRVGFGILEPIETSDTPATTDQYDREAVEQNPDLAADDDL